MRVKQANKKIPLKLVRKVRRKRRIRGKISGTSTCPRLSVFRSNRHFYAQAIDDVSGVTLSSVSSYGKEYSNVTIETVQKLGVEFSNVLFDKGIKSVVFDRNGYRYHGIVKAFADSVRKKITF